MSRLQCLVCLILLLILLFGTEGKGETPVNEYPEFQIEMKSVFRCYVLCYRWKACQGVEYDGVKMVCSLRLDNTSPENRDHIFKQLVQKKGSNRALQRIKSDVCSKNQCLLHEICLIFGSGNICKSSGVYCGIPDVPNGDVHITLDGWGPSKAELICQSGHRHTFNSSPAYCHTNGRWSKFGSICTKVNCGKPVDVSNGNFQYEATTYNSVANLNCIVGYQTYENTNSTIICKADGHWSNSVASCGRVDCNNPNNPSNGQTIAQSTRYGDIAEIKCDRGFEYSGENSTIVCLASGNWSDINRACVKVDCQIPNSPENAKILTTSTRYNDVAKVICNVGYTFAGEDTSIVCQANAKWSAIQGQCDITECDKPVSELNCRVKDYKSFHVGRVDITNLQDCSVVVEWPAVNTPCRVVDCNSPHNVLNEYSTRYLTKVCVQCNGQQDGVWSFHEIECSQYRNWTEISTNCAEICPGEYSWSRWYDRDNPSANGDFETLKDLLEKNNGSLCNAPKGIQATLINNKPHSDSSDFLHAFDTTSGLICLNKDQESKF